MSSQSLNNYSQSFQEQDEEEMQAEEYFIKQRLRREAYARTTDYVHPRVNFFDHQPIDSKESEELRRELISQYKPRVEFVRGQYDPEELTKDYDNVYGEFVKMTLKNEYQERVVTESIGEMHEMADILLAGNKMIPKDGVDGNNNKGTLYLYSKNELTQNQQEEIERVFDNYERAYRQGVEVDDGQAGDTIKRAKMFLRQRYA